MRIRSPQSAAELSHGSRGPGDDRRRSAGPGRAAGDAGRHSDLVGYALDGYGLYGPFGENGARLTNADLDACHGHTHTIPWDGAPVSLYHYHVTREYPYTVGCYHGTPAARPGPALRRLAPPGPRLP